ncbi:MAG: hypothetical protein K6L81_08880 [Agarilytica sp.]
MKQRFCQCWYFILLSVFLGGLGCLSSAVQAQEQPLRQIEVYLDTSLESFSDMMRVRSFRLIAQSFYELGYSVSFGFQPPRRVIHSIENGKVGVMCLRAAGVEQGYSNFFRVPESVHQLSVFAYVSDTRGPDSGQWRDMDVEKVGLLYGAQYTENYIPQELLQKRVVTTPDWLTAARMVHVDRVDMAAFPEIVYEAYFAGENETMEGLTRLEPALGTIDMYCFLHQRYQSLLKPLTAQIRRLKRASPFLYDDSRYPVLISDHMIAGMPIVPGFSPR